MEVLRERVFLGLGSNLGDRESALDRALEALGRLPDTRVAAVSTYRVTAPWGLTDQPEFLNAAVEIRTRLEPAELLAAVKEIERELGRKPAARWGPRLIDIDLLLYGDRQVREPGLTIPHPEILNREFVWGPLGEIAPEVVEELRRAALSL